MKLLKHSCQSILILFFLVNCIGFNYRYSKDLSHLAKPDGIVKRVLPGDPNYPSKDLTLLLLDRNVRLYALDDDSSIPNDFTYLVIKPGPHVAQIRYSSPNFRSVSSIKINFIAKPNHTVVLCAEANRSGWNPEPKNLEGFMPETNATFPCSRF